MSTWTASTLATRQAGLACLLACPLVSFTRLACSSPAARREVEKLSRVARCIRLAKCPGPLRSLRTWGLAARTPNSERRRHFLRYVGEVGRCWPSLRTGCARGADLQRGVAGFHSETSQPQNNNSLCSSGFPIKFRLQRPWRSSSESPGELWALRGNRRHYRLSVDLRAKIQQEEVLQYANTWRLNTGASATWRARSHLPRSVSPATAVAEGSDTPDVSCRAKECLSLIASSCRSLPVRGATRHFSHTEPSTMHFRFASCQTTFLASTCVLL